MGKDRTGKYHPPKGKPSGAGKEEGLGIQSTDPEKMDQYLDITDRYTAGEDEIAAHVPVRHPNRNTEKGHTRFKNQQDAQESRKSEEYMPVDERGPAVTPEELPRMLSKEQFAELANFRADNCISIYLPTHSAGVEVNEQNDHKAFKQALQELTNTLKNKGLNQGVIEKLLEPCYALQRDDAFWRSMTPGFGMFVADGYCKFIKLPMTVEREVMVNHSFFVTPLTELLRSKEYFYLLVISKKQVKLFRADAFGMEFINVPGLPEGMLDAQAPDKDEETTFRTGGRGGTGGANFHGIGGGNNVDDKQKIATYFETADDVIWKEVLHRETAPLLLAGVEYLIPVYKSVTDYKHVCEEALTGSHEREDTPTLYRQAMEKMSYHFKQRFNKAVEMYGNQSATSLTTSVVDDIIPAAHYGQVSHLFVRKGEHLWGSFDEMANELKWHSAEEEGSEDLLDIAAVRTLLSGGEVFVVEKEQMPADSVLAAILRY
jgi:hypothetical protein